jgi:hypothetical protein
MNYLPYENITYLSKLNIDQISERLNNVVEPERNNLFFKTFKRFSNFEYTGTVQSDSFKIVRIIQYRNSFLPRIKGVIESDLQGTIVKVKMRMHPFVLVFCVIWFGILSIGIFFMTLVLLTSAKFEPASLIPYGMFLFGYVLVTAGFRYESKKSKFFLAELFEAEIIKD